MKIPPPVTYPTGALAHEGLITVALATVWLLVQSLWGWHLWQAAGGFPAAWWLSMAAGSLWLLWNCWRLRAAPVGELRWEHRRPSAGSSSPQGVWVWRSPAWRRGLMLSEVRCTLDFDQLMVFHVRSPTGLGFWVWCRARQAPSDWLAFRRAAHAHRHKDLHIGQPGRGS
jgi:hypothetical protein